MVRIGIQLICAGRRFDSRMRFDGFIPLEESAGPVRYQGWPKPAIMLEHRFKADNPWRIAVLHQPTMSPLPPRKCAYKGQ